MFPDRHEARNYRDRHQWSAIDYQNYKNGLGKIDEVQTEIHLEPLVGCQDARSPKSVSPKVSTIGDREDTNPHRHKVGRKSTTREDPK